jgi:hypothetical protein
LETPWIFIGRRFEEKDLKDGNGKMGDGRWKMEDGRWKMEDGRWESEVQVGNSKH